MAAGAAESRDAVHYGLALLIAICVLAAFLRLYRLGFQGLSLDEAYTVLRAERPWREYVAATAGAESAAPLYLLLMRLWVHLGRSEFIVRLPSALLGVCAIPLVYRLGSIIVSRRVGLASAFLLAVSPFHLAYSREARPYPLLVVLTLVAGIAFVEMWKADGSGRWTRYITASALAVYAHYFAVLALLSHGVAAFVHRGDAQAGRRFRWRWLAAAAVVAALLLPWSAALVSGAATRLSQGVTPIPRVGAWLLAHAFFQFSVDGGWMDFHSPGDLVRYLPILAALGALFGGLFLVGLIGLRRNARALAFTLSGLAVPVGILFALHQVAPLFIPRYIIFCLPVYLIVVAAGAVGLLRAGRGAALTLLALASLVFAYPQFTDPDFRDPWRQIASDVRREAKAGDLIAFHMKYVTPAFRYYYRGPCEIVGLPSDPARGREPSPTALARVLSTSGRVWLVLAYDHGTGSAYERILSHRRVLCWQAAYGKRGRFRVRVYAPRVSPISSALSSAPGPCATWQPPCQALGSCAAAGNRSRCRS